MHRALKRLSISFKMKTIQPVERDEHARLHWLEAIGRFDPERLVFVDESGTHTAFTRLYARATRGERAFGSAPRGRGRIQTLNRGIVFEWSDRRFRD